MNADLDTIVARIRKLMALTAERGATEAEAALAADHVQRLLAEHNLSMASVEASGASSGEGGRRVREQGVGSRQVYKWQRSLMQAVAELNFCKAFARFQDRGPSRPQVFDGYDLIGRVDNVTTTRVMFEYLLQTIERLARDDVQDPSQYFTRYAHSFKEGCSDRLVERLQDQQQAIIEEQEAKAREDAARARHPASAPGTGLAVVLRDVIRNEQDLNNDLINGWKPGTTAANRAQDEARRAARDAREAELVAAGYPPAVALYMSCGYSEESARKLAQPCEPVPETENQRRKRQRKDHSWWDRMHRNQQREYDRLDRTGYRKGHAAGADVSLNRQVDKNRQEKLS